MLVDKPAGITSHDVVAAVRRRWNTRAVGHTGTLDPFATGLLVLVLGGATRLARFIEAERKRYRATARLGFATDTDDRTGTQITESFTGSWPERQAIEAALGELVGSGLQRPPAYSAKQVEGRRSHAVARRGGTMALEPVPVEIERVALLDYQPPLVEFDATVGPGTYLRAMARDLGERLGTGAHLTELRRLAVGRFAVEAALPLERLTGMEPLLDPLELVAGMPRVDLAEGDAGRVRHGQVVGQANGPGPVALVAEGRLVAVGEAKDGRWQPVVVLAA